MPCPHFPADGNKALNVTGRSNILMVQRPEGATPLGDVASNNIIIDPDYGVTPADIAM